VTRKAPPAKRRRTDSSTSSNSSVSLLLKLLNNYLPLVTFENDKKLFDSKF